MPEIKNTFLKGKMNKDADERLLPSGEYRDALNIQVGVSENGDAGSLHNILGNSKISSINISGAKCIGSIADTENEKIYWFIYGTNIDAIAEYNEITGVIAPVLVDTTKLILKFPNYQITGINILEGYLAWTDNNSEPKLIDIDLFKSRTTSFTTTSKIFDSVLNADRDIIEEDITVIRKKPNNAPIVNIDTFGPTLKNNGVEITVSGNTTGLTVGDTFTATFSQDPNLNINDTFWIRTSSIWVFPVECSIVDFPTATTATLKIIYDTWALKGAFNSEIKAGDVLFENKFVRFAYRFKFNNDQYSVMSPFSETVFSPVSMPSYDSSSGYNEGMVNSVRFIRLSGINATDPKIKAVDILYKESNNTNVYVYKTINKEDLTNYNTTNASIEITKESAYNVLPETQLFRQYDNVPYRAKAQEIVGNRIIYGNYIDGINITKSLDGKVTEFLPNFNVNISERQTYINKSIKTGKTYQIGVLFEDEYGRQTPVISDDSGTKSISYNNVRSSALNGGSQFEVSMDPLPSDVIFDDRIKRFKYYIKDYSEGYYNLTAIDAYIDNDNDDNVWIVFPSYEVNKIQEDDYIIFKRPYAGGLGVNNKKAKYKVLDIKTSRPETMEAGRLFEDSFFVKVKKDSYITDYLLGRLRATEVESSEFNKLDYIPENSLFLTYVENGTTKTEYYFKNGKVYEVDTDITTTPSTDSNINYGPMSPACAVSLPNEYGSLINGGSDFNFDDTTGQIDKVYLKFKSDDATSHIYKITSFYFCYDISGGVGFTGNEPAIFETVPKSNLLDLYYETEKSYDISEYTQTKTLQWFNCFDFGNGIESDRIRDDYNEATIGNGARVSTVIDKTYQEKINKNSLIFSGIFNARNDFNRLNEFNVAENITKNLNPEYGSIQKLHTRNTDLITFCEDKVLRVLANKDALYNADGNINLTSVNNVLGQSIPYSGEFGISKNPESFAEYGYQVYFTDKARNAVLRLSMDGLTVISNYGMSDFFRDKFNLETLEESIAFKEGVDGWTSRLSFVPESGLSLNGKYYTFKSGELWKHYNSGTNYNNFYNTQYDSKVKFIYNQDPSTIKSFKTLGYEGTANWYADSIETDAQSGKVPTFINKEGKWFNQIQGIETNTSNIDPKEFSIQGLGNISSYSGTLSDASSTPSTSSETLITPENIIGTYDIYSKQYILSFTSKPTLVLPPTDCSFSIEIVGDFDCTYAGLSISDGITGNTVVGTTTRGTIQSISPSTYQQGSNTYTAQIIAPSGYNNSSELVACTATANALSLFECADAGLSIPDGNIGDAVTGTVSLGTIVSFTPSTYISGTNNYAATITVPSGYYNSGSTISCEDSATGTSATTTTTTAAPTTTTTTAATTTTTTSGPTTTTTTTGTTTTTTTTTAPGLTNGWKFTAGTANVGGTAFNGFHQGTLLGCSSTLGHGSGSSPTTSTTALPGIDCYDSGLFLVTKGYGINGVGNVSSYALTQFDDDTSGGIAFGIINTSGVGNPGSGSLSGTITGSDGSSGTWSVSYSAIVSYTDNNGNGSSITPESTGQVSLSGLTITNGVTYTINT